MIAIANINATKGKMRQRILLSACFNAGLDMTSSDYCFCGVQQHQYSAYSFFKAPRT
ncbi:hypothetical protein [Pseudomonas sp. NPDC087626]|uniref:hypothetical protein n=1 Tax=Pseudomonas sp. NPDC087626 TaxID=3364444 RepID=UPI0037F4F8B7